MEWMGNSRSVLVQPPEATEPAGPSGDFPRVVLHVIFTTWPGTIAALRVADRQSQSLGARIVIWFFQTVPRQFPASSPPISTSFIRRRLRAMARKCCRNAEVEIRICLCTNQLRSMEQAFASDAVVLAGGRKRWWRSREQKMTAFLRSCGYRALFVRIEPKSSGVSSTEPNRGKPN
jgi:hypothetical protein